MTTEREEAFRFLRARRGPEALSPLASELGHGVLRHRSRIDWIIEHLSGRKRRDIDPPVLDVLRLGLYQLLCSSVPPYAAVSESVELAKRVAPRGAGFVNWVLRRAGPEVRDLPRRSDVKEPLRWMAVFHSFPPWIVKRWVSRFGAGEAESLLAAMNDFPPLDVRVNLLSCTRAQAAAELRAAGAEAVEGVYSPAALAVAGLRVLTSLPAFREGRLYIQDQSAQLAALALDPRPGERVLDACAGVGGKATHMAEITGGQAVIAAVDRDGGRLRLLESNARRLGLEGIRALQGDLLDGSFDPGGPFDRILLDVPCSSLGIIRRHPELKWLKRASDIARFAALQSRLLEGTWRHLAPGGTLAYSTCTTEPEENEEVVRAFLEAHPDAAVLPPPATIGRAAELLTPEGFIAALPHRHGMNGSFLALLLRRS